MAATREMIKDMPSIVYARVSNFATLLNSDGHRKDDDSIDAQKDKIASYIDNLHRIKPDIRYPIVDYFFDEGFSGKNTVRPAYQRMTRTIKSGKVKILFASELSRLSRSVVDFLELVKLCDEYGVSIIILNLPGFDTSTPIGRVLVVILVALAQFEREMTRERVVNNALIRLMNDGKINGASEILGLVSDPKRKGHFLKNPEGIKTLEVVLKLILKFSSKKKILEVAREMGLKGPKGREFTMRVIDGVLKNVGSRYRGLYKADLETHYKGQTVAHTTDRYIKTTLLHGPVVDEKLLDQVQAKLDSCARKPIKAGKNGYVYLLSDNLVHEDGSRYNGQAGKDIRYYWNQKQRLRIHCDAIDELVIKEIKSHVADNDRFKKLVEDAVKRRQVDLPKVDDEIRLVQKTLTELNQKDQQIRDRLLGSELTDSLVKWLSNEVDQMTKDKKSKEAELVQLQKRRAEILDESGLRDIQGQIKKALQGFDGLTRVQQRLLLGKAIHQIVVRSDNHIEIKLVGSEGSDSVVTRRNCFLESKEIGGADGIRTRGLLRDRQTL